MYGVFDINIGVGDTEIPAVAFNHLTRAGMQYVLKGKPERIQTTIVPTAKNKIFTKTLNYMFFIVSKEENSPDPIPDDGVYNLTFDNLPENIIWIDYGTTNTSLNMPLGETETVYIRGVGIGHKDIGGDEANNFIFSYANTNITVTNKRYDGATNGYKFWNFNANYTFTSYTNTQPAIGVTLGDKTYMFKQSNVTESLYGYTSDFTNYLGFSNWTGPNLSSMHSAKPAFYWWICGRPGAAPEKFEELIVEDPITREMSRVFKVSYYNQRPFDIDITGFFYVSGTRSFNYRSEIDNYIRVPAGKRLELTFAVDIAGGQLPSVNNSYFSFNTPPTSQGYDANGLMGHTYRVKVHAVQYEGTTKEKKLSYDDTYSLSNWFNDELTKVYYELGDGTFTAPTYVLGTKTPTSYSIAAPSIPTTDGWVINNAKLQFAITAPTGVTRVQFTTRDNVWETYTVTPGTINYIDLPLRFLYENEMFIRWGNASTTGLITYYVGRLVNTTELIAIEPTLNSNTGQNFGVLAYPSRKALTLPWKYSNEQQLVWNTLPLTAYTSPPYGPLYFNSHVGAKAIKIDDTVKWFNPVTRTLDAVPAFLQQYTSNYVVTDNGWFDIYPDIGQRRAVQSTSTTDVPFNGTPRISDLVRVIGPTEAKPNSFKLYTLSGTRKVEIYNTDNNAIIKTLDVVPGTEYTVNILEPLYNHIYYGIRYLDDNGVNQSLGLEYLFKGIELAKPDEIRDIHYDIGTKTLTFVTPARAKRATITRWGFELYSFETVEGGETNLYTSEALDTAGNYILTLYNDEGVPNTPYYIFGQQPDDQPVKPGTTGPYHFNDWVYNSNNYTTDGNLPFLKIEQYEAGTYKVRIDGNLARVVEEKRNASNLLMSVMFEANGCILFWETGYIDTNTTPGSASSTSQVNMIYGGNGYNIVEVWNEWDLYNDLGIEIYGTYGYGKYTPKFGKSTSWYQFSEVQTGYVKNSLKLLMRRNDRGMRIPYEYDTTLTAKTPYAQIFPHTNDIVGSPNYNSNVNSQYYKYTIFTPYINGVAGTWEATFNEANTAVTKLKAITPNMTLILDTANKDIGWTIEGFDESKIGDPDFKDISYTFSLYAGNKYSWSQYMGSYPTSTSIDTSSNSAVRASSTYYVDQIFTRFYPYMELATFKDATGIDIDKALYEYSGDHSWNENACWSEAYLNGNIAGMMENTTVIIGGKIATVTTKEVTIPYTPTVAGIISNTQYEKPTVFGVNQVNSAEQVPFTFTAHVFTTDTAVISNEKHPRVLSVVTDLRSNKTNTIIMVFVRNRILQPTFALDYYSNTLNVRPNNAITQYGNYYYPYTTIAFYPEYPKVMKDMNSVGTWNFEPNYVNRSPLSSLYIISQFIKQTVPTSEVLPENNTYKDMFKVNDVAFDLVIEAAWITWLADTEKANPYEGNIAKLTNADHSKEITFDQHSKVTYIGFAAGEQLVITIADFGEAETNWINTVEAIYNDVGNSPICQALDTSLSGMSMGYNKSTFWNYVAHTIPTGLQGLKFTVNAKLLEPTVFDENFTLPDRTAEIIERFSTNFNADYGITFDNSFAATLFEPGTPPDFNVLLQHIDMYCNDVKANAMEVDDDFNIKFTFPGLNIQAIFTSTSRLQFWDTETNALLNRDELFIFKFVTNGLNLNDNGTPFAFAGEPMGNNDAAVYNVLWPFLSFYNDVNGTERYQTMYVITGKKPRADVPIDPRIGNSPYPSFSQNSYTYTAMLQMEMPS